MKKIIITTLAVVMATMLFTGCGEETKETKKKDNDGVEEIRIEEIEVEEIRVEKIIVEDVIVEDIYVDDEYMNEKNYNSKGNVYTWDNGKITYWDD